MRLYVLCEGQTEDRFVKEILRPYLQNLNIFATPIICETKRMASKKYKGGVSKYGKSLKGCCFLMLRHFLEWQGLTIKQLPSLRKSKTASLLRSI